MKAAKFPALWLLFTAARVLAVGLPVTLLAACEEGVFEEAGEEVDDAVDDAKDSIDRRN
jgi:hypothetical protein